MVWNHNLIKEKILEAKSGLGVDYMPTRAQLNKYYGDTRLSNKVNKTLGYYGWAKELGIKIQNNDTRKGKLAEAWAAEYLTNLGFCVEQMAQNYPFDLLVDGCVKVDVKFSNVYRSDKGFGFYSFALRKRVATCDVYLLVASSETGARTVYILPANKANQSQISIGLAHSIYDKYIDNVECIKRISKALSEV